MKAKIFTCTDIYFVRTYIRSFQLKAYLEDQSKTLALPLIISIALVGLTWYPSMASSNARSRGSQRAERLAPWHRPAEDTREPKAITAWNFCSELVLDSRVNTMRGSEVNCRRSSAVKILEFRNADEFAPSRCNLWMNHTQCVGLTKWEGNEKENFHIQNEDRIGNQLMYLWNYTKTMPC